MDTLPEAPAPLIVTAALEASVQAHYDALRRKHFPAERNHLGAHLTLFHALPGDQQAPVDEVLLQQADRPALPATVAKVMSLGRGVAFRIVSPELITVRAGIADQFTDQLTAQDRGKGEFHVTVQNKVEPEIARALRDELDADFKPYETTITGLSLWRYLGGPWEAIANYPFD